MRLSESFVTILLGGAFGLTCSVIGFAQTPAPQAAGEAVYKQRCATCHEQTNPRIPPRSALNQMPATRILRTLDFGAMMTVAYPMSRAERKAVAAFIGTNAPAISFPPSAYCSDRSVTVSDKPKAAWNGWSADANEKKGALLWEVRIATRGPNTGPSVGVQWGMSTDGQRVYAATSASSRTAPKDPLDTRRNILDPQQGGGLTAVYVRDGSRAWYAPPIVCTPNAASGCSPAQSSAVTGIPGVVFSASMDGHLRGYSAEDGRVIWDFDTTREFQTVNGIKAKGGSIDGPGPVVVNGMVFINSGYSRFGGLPGNVLLALAP